MANTTNTVNVSEIPVDATDPTKTGWGAVLADQPYFAIATGTAADETFDAADLSATTRARMDANQRGVTVNMGDGNDIITGSAYGDALSAGAGVNYVDGGANDGIQPWGGRSADMLDVYVADAAAAAAVTVVALDASSAGADATAFGDGFRFKVTNGTTETTYVKGIEQVNLRLEGSREFLGSIRLAVQVHEVEGSAADLASHMHYAWAHGTAGADSFDAAADVSAATQAKMAGNGRGVWVDTGAGNDTIRGSAYGDNIAAGAGTNYVDGGAHGGSTPWGGKPEDVLQLTVSSIAEANAVQVIALAGSTDAADISAAANGYTHKVVNAAGAETDYIKNIERVSVQVFDGANWSFGRDIPLAIRVHEANLADAGIGTYHHVAWVNGTAGSESIDLAAGTSLLTAPLAAQMAAGKQGVWIDGGAGDDVITGSGFADAIRNGAGNAKIDGGANVSAEGRWAKDIFEIGVASQAELDAIQVTASDDPAYTWMVTYGAGSTQKDYLKNIEGISAYVNGGGGGKWIPLALDVHEIAGTEIANHMHFAWATGTALGDTFNAATDVSATTRALMDAHSRGVYVDTGAGDDTITGSAYGDDIYAGSGTNRVDGGANDGMRPYGGKAEDVLRITVDSAAAAEAVQVTALDATTGSAADIAEFGNGYTHKVVNGADINYIKGIERISVQVNSGGAWSFGRDIALTVSVQEANLADANIGAYQHVAWVHGTGGGDTVDLAAGTPLLSAALAAQMATARQGVWVDGGAGNDVITGTGYADAFRNGAGNSKIDGGDDVSDEGRFSKDTFEIAVASQAALDAVTVAPSDDPAYTWMVTYGAGSTQKDYLKNIEAVSVYLEGGGNGRWIPLTLDVQEVRSQDAATSYHHAWAMGTEQADTFNAATDVSAPTRALMELHGRGIYADTGGGSDTVTGSAFADHIVAGKGNDYVDGGANSSASQDVLQLTVASAAAAAAVTVTKLEGTGSAEDVDAFARGYTHKVVQPEAGGETDYVKGIERISIQVFDGANWSYGRDIALGITVQEANLAAADIDSYHHVAWVQGTASADIFSLAAGTPLLSPALAAQMAGAKQGVWVDGGAGDDTITGTGYADSFRNGAGNSRIDGGANDAGAGRYAGDMFDIEVADQAALDAVKVTPSDDPAYAWMVTYGEGSTQKDYLKNIEAVNVYIAGGAGKSIPLGMSIIEVDGDDNLPAMSHFAWVNGTDSADTFNAATDISAATRALMATHGRGVSVTAGAGDDRITGSAYGDDISGGAGTNYIDAGADNGKAVSGFGALDRLRVSVGSSEEAAAVQVTKLAAGAGSAADIAAFNLGYTHKLATGSGAETDYLKGVETIDIMAPYAGGGQTVARRIYVELTVSEINLDDPGHTSSPRVAYAYGTDGADVINMGAGTTLLSDAAKTEMAASKRGVTVIGGSGDDIITGSGYVDNFRNGAGNSKIDGGAQDSYSQVTNKDRFDIQLNTQAEVDAVQVLKSDDPAYEWMVTYGPGSTQKDYLRNIEAVSIFSNDGGNRWVPLALEVNVVDPGSPDLLNQSHFAWARGTEGNDTFSAATNVPAGTRALMDTHKRGVWADMGAGDDTATGSAYGDTINGGLGTNYIDGGANGGTSSGYGARDYLEIVVGSKAEGDAIRAETLSATAGSAADIAAFGNGYTHKVFNAAGTRTDYVKGIETVTIQVYDGTSYSGSRQIALAVTVSEIDLAAPGQGAYSTVANVTGSFGTDTIDLAAGTSLLSAAIQANMLETHRGAHVDGGSGDDVIIGTAYVDSFRNGSGNSKIDGGANATKSAYGNKDRFDIELASQAEIDAVMVVESDDPNYQWMVTYGPGSTQKDYLKNIEGVSVYAAGATSRWIPLAVDIFEEKNDADVGSQSYFASAQGTERADSFNAGTDISAATRAMMAEHGRGVYVDLREGNDRIVGSAYGDTIRAGSGTNYIDGGANGGTTPHGGIPRDALLLDAASKADLDNLSVTILSAASEGADLAAFNDGYTFKVVNGATSVDYIRNIEQLHASHWNDANGNGQQDSGEYSSRSVNLALNIHVEKEDPARPGYLTNGEPIENMGSLAYVSGTDFDDSFNASTDLPASALALMSTYQRGVYADLGAGNDRVTGTAFGDTISAGNGVNYVDGGANLGKYSNGGARRDALDVFVADQATADAAVMVTLGAASTGADAAAFADGYTYRISAGAQTTFIKNIEEARLFIRASETSNATHVKNFAIPVNDAPFVRTGTVGVSVVTKGKDYNAESGAILPDGKIITVGYLSMDGATYEWALTRLNADGTLDTSFGDNGHRIISANNVGSLAELRVQADGKVVVALTLNNGTDTDFKLIRTNADGSPDTTFGNGTGSVMLQPGAGNDRVSGIELQPDGKIVVSGSSGPAGPWTSTTDTSMAVMRVNADGSVDTGFGGGTGKVLVAVGVEADYASDVTVQPDGKLLLTGSSSTGGKSDFVMVRLNPNGTPDASFGSGGTVKIAISALGNDSGRVAVVQPDGKILVAANAMIGPDDDFSIMRLNADGSLDTSFGNAGIASIRVSGWHDNANSITLQDDGKILVGGSAGYYGNQGIEDFALVRLNADGSTDSSFGYDNSGIVITRISAFADYSRTVMVHGDGTISVVGMAGKDADYNGSLALVRLGADGRLDQSVNEHWIGYSPASGPVVLAPDVSVFDPELLEQGNFAGATLSVSRHGGADADDVFSAIGSLVFENGAVKAEGIDIGTVDNTGGTLTIHFDSDATHYLVELAMRSIAYATTETGVQSVVLDWSFDDGNTGSQGEGGVLDDTGSIVVTLIGVQAN